MSLAKTTRVALHFNQSEFAQFLAERTGRSVTQPMISRYECGVNQMNMAQVEICAPVASMWLAVETRGMQVGEAAELILNALQ